MKNLIERFKWARKKNYIQQAYAGKYAFVGIGNHSIHHLYPVLDYLRAPLKYIVTKTAKTAKLVGKNYPGITATDDYNRVLTDDEIRGILICAHPCEHYSLTKSALEQGKNVFVEKPLCTSPDELKEIIALTQKTGACCVAGMQKRYSTATKLLTRRLRKDKVLTYNYRFAVGRYPEGDIISDIFIHPIDLIYFLFGDYSIVSFCKKEAGKGLCTLMLQTEHKDVIGTIEISTLYSWNHPVEELTVNTTKGIYTLMNHQQLMYMPKTPGFMGMPMEKVLKTTPVKEYLYDANNFLPVSGNNQIVSQGYFNEIKTFLDLCEGKDTENLSAPDSLVCTYRSMETFLK